MAASDYRSCRRIADSGPSKGVWMYHQFSAAGRQKAGRDDAFLRSWLIDPREPKILRQRRSTMNPQRQLGLVLEPDALRPLSSLFHRLSRIMRDDQQLFTVPANMSVTDAISLMKEKNFSQLPIREGKDIVGVFSYRSFAVQATELKDPQARPLALTVGDFAEDLPFVAPSDPFDEVIEKLEWHDALLLGTPENTVGIVTAMDVLRYLYGATSPYVLVAEVELAIRALMSHSLGGRNLNELFERCLRGKYKEKLPESIQDLTFDDYQTVITFSNNWQLFKDTFGSTPPNVRNKLIRARDLRNALFHFRRGITLAEYDELVDIRKWLRRRSRILEGQEGAQQ
jgi:predicted transcriptional regulator